MTSTIMPVAETPEAASPPAPAPAPAPAPSAPPAETERPEPRHPVLTALGERTRALRHRRGLTRKALSAAAGVSERHLANLEYGVGNASILVLRQVAEALGCPLSDLLDEGPAASPEWALIRSLLAGRDDAVLRRARAAVEQALTAESPAAAPGPRPRRVALVGLRGAGKSTLGRLLGEDLGVPFVELSREIERLAGCTIGEIQALYGLDGYRRHERRALEAAIEGHDEAVIAVPGGLVSDPATFRLLLARCTTVWLRAAPEDHMRRVAAQGDLRPMAASDEAMEDLRAILAARAAFYSRAEFELDTSAAPLPATFERLRHLVRGALGLPA